MVNSKTSYVPVGGFSIFDLEQRALRRRRRPFERKYQSHAASKKMEAEQELIRASHRKRMVERLDKNSNSQRLANRSLVSIRQELVTSGLTSSASAPVLHVGQSPLSPRKEQHGDVLQRVNVDGLAQSAKFLSLNEPSLFTPGQHTFDMVALENKLNESLNAHPLLGEHPDAVWEREVNRRKRERVRAEAKQRAKEKKRVEREKLNFSLAVLGERNRTMPLFLVSQHEKSLQQQEIASTTLAPLDDTPLSTPLSVVTPASEPEDVAVEPEVELTVDEKLLIEHGKEDVFDIPKEPEPEVKPEAPLHWSKRSNASSPAPVKVTTPVPVSPPRAVPVVLVKPEKLRKPLTPLTPGSTKKKAKKKKKETKVMHIEDKEEPITWTNKVNTHQDLDEGEMWWEQESGGYSWNDKPVGLTGGRSSIGNPRDFKWMKQQMQRSADAARIIQWEWRKHMERRLSRETKTEQRNNKIRIRELRENEAALAIQHAYKRHYLLKSGQQLQPVVQVHSTADEPPLDAMSSAVVPVKSDTESRESEFFWAEDMDVVHYAPGVAEGDGQYFGQVYENFEEQAAALSHENFQVFDTYIPEPEGFQHSSFSRQLMSGNVSPYKDATQHPGKRPPIAMRRWLMESPKKDLNMVFMDANEDIEEQHSAVKSPVRIRRNPTMFRVQPQSYPTLIASEHNGLCVLYDPLGANFDGESELQASEARFREKQKKKVQAAREAEQKAQMRRVMSKRAVEAARKRMREYAKRGDDLIKEQKQKTEMHNAQREKQMQERKTYAKLAKNEKNDLSRTSADVNEALDLLESLVEESTRVVPKSMKERRQESPTKTAARLKKRRAKKESVELSKQQATAAEDVPETKADSPLKIDSSAHIAPADMSRKSRVIKSAVHKMKSLTLTESNPLLQHMVSRKGLKEINAFKVKAFIGKMVDWHYDNVRKHSLNLLRKEYLHADEDTIKKYFDETDLKTDAKLSVAEKATFVEVAGQEMLEVLDMPMRSRLTRTDFVNAWNIFIDSFTV